MSQPRVAVGAKEGCVGFVRVGSDCRREMLSGTERPRLHFPPRVLDFSDCVVAVVSAGCFFHVVVVLGEMGGEKRSRVRVQNLLEPVQRAGGEVVLPAVLA